MFSFVVMGFPAGTTVSGPTGEDHERFVLVFCMVVAALELCLRVRVLFSVLELLKVENPR